MNEKLNNYLMQLNLTLLILIGFLFQTIWLLAILQAYYVGKINSNEKERLKQEKWKKERRQKYLKKFRILKLTIGEWIAIIILVLIIIGLILLYV